MQASQCASRKKVHISRTRMRLLYCEYLGRSVYSALKRSIRRFVITEKAPTRAFSWLKAATTAFTFKTLC